MNMEIIDGKFVAMFDFLETKRGEQIPFVIRYIFKGEYDQSWDFGRGESFDLFIYQAIVREDIGVLVDNVDKLNSDYSYNYSLDGVLLAATYHNSPKVIKWLLRDIREPFFDLIYSLDLGLGMHIYMGIFTHETFMGLIDLKLYKFLLDMYLFDSEGEFLKNMIGFTYTFKRWIMLINNQNASVDNFKALWDIVIKNVSKQEALDLKKEIKAYFDNILNKSDNIIKLAHQLNL